MEAVAGALYGRAVALGALGRVEEEVDAYDDFLSRFEQPPGRIPKGQVAEAMTGKGAALRRLGRLEEALGAYGEIVERFGSARDEAPRQRGAGALLSKGPTPPDPGLPT